MSRIGKLPVAIPAGVEVKLEEGNVITVKGPKGTLTRKLVDDLDIKVEGSEVIVTRPSDLKRYKSLHGLTRTLIFNMVEGVTMVILRNSKSTVLVTEQQRLVRS